MSDYDENDLIDNDNQHVEEPENQEGSGAEHEDHSNDHESDQNRSGYVETDDPKVKERLARLTREKHDALRAKHKVEQEARQYREELEKLKAPKEVTAPGADLAIDDPAEFARQQQAYFDHIRQKTEHDNKKKELEQREAQTKQQEFQAAAQKYTERAKQLKIDESTLQQAAALVHQAEVSQDLVSYLLRHENGPKIVVDLAADPELLYEIATLSPIEAAARIERMQIKRNPPPPPPTRVNGSRASTYRENDGTTFE